MQIPSIVNKLVGMTFYFICANAHPEVSNGNLAYTLVDHNGLEFNSAQAEQRKGMYFRRSSKKGSFTDFRVPEFDSMLRTYNFSYELLDDSLISTSQGDYFVVESMRSIAWRPEEDTDYVNHPQWWTHRCGHGVHLTYLVGAVNKKIKIIKKYLTECTSETKLYSSHGRVGYEVKGYGRDAGKSVLYLLQKNGSFIRKENGPYKEVP